MFNQFSQQLKQWHPKRDTQKWVLGTLYKIDGPSYRSPGAMMFFSDAGEQFGLLSGGCLEADMHKKASQVMRSQRPMTVCYDASDEADMSFLLDIGCGGMIHILLQPLNFENDYLQLPLILDALENREGCLFLQKITEQGELAEADVWFKDNAKYSAMAVQLSQKNACLAELNKHSWLVTAIRPPFHLLVVGGGIDVRPLVSLAATMGWEITLCDPRPANARREHFMSVSTILRCPPLALVEEALFEHFDAAIVITHNLQLDADALAALQRSAVRYLGLLGPIVRKEKVLALAGLDANTLSVPVAGPAGLRLGGELPENVALSIIAECQAVINGADAKSISNVL